jgi:hypothetical protein
VDALRSAAGTIVTLTPGEPFARTGEHAFTLRPDRTEHHRWLGALLAGQPLRAVVDLRLAEAPADEAPGARLRAAQQDLVAATSAFSDADSPPWLLVTRGALTTGPSDPARDPAAAATAALAAAFAAETPTRPGSVLDLAVDPGEPAAEATGILAALAADAGPITAWRDGALLGPVLRPLAVAETHRTRGRAACT